MITESNQVLQIDHNCINDLIAITHTQYELLYFIVYIQNRHIKGYDHSLNGNGSYRNNAHIYNNHI